MNHPATDLKIALLPIDIVDAEVEQNIATYSERIAALPADTDLIILPELAFTGFINDAEAMAQCSEPNDGRCVGVAKEWAKQKDAAIIGGFSAIDSDGRLYNRLFIILPDGTATFYDKRHLFCLGGESKIFTPGSELPPVVEFRSWRLSTIICYDLRFPVWNRNVDLAYDALIVPSNWPNSRFYTWDTLLKARAIENQAYVVGCDREGEDANGRYVRGDSMIINPWGEVVSRTADDGTIFGTFIAADFNRARTIFTPWRDADTFTIDL